MLWGNSFHPFLFNEYFWSFITCQVLFKEQGNAGQQDGQNPCSGNLHWEILQIPEHNHLGSLNLCCRLNIKPSLPWCLNILVYSFLSNRGNWASLQDRTHTFCVLPVLPRCPSCLWCGCHTSAAQGGLSIVHCCILLLAPVKTVVNEHSWVFFRWTAYHLALKKNDFWTRSAYCLAL